MGSGFFIEYCIKIALYLILFFYFPGKFFWVEKKTKTNRSFFETDVTFSFWFRFLLGFWFWL